VKSLHQKNHCFLLACVTTKTKPLAHITTDDESNLTHQNAAFHHAKPRRPISKTQDSGILLHIRATYSSEKHVLHRCMLMRSFIHAQVHDIAMHMKSIHCIFIDIIQMPSIACIKHNTNAIHAHITHNTYAIHAMHYTQYLRYKHTQYITYIAHVYALYTSIHR
jgi:hypothetical protein